MTDRDLQASQSHQSTHLSGHLSPAFHVCLAPDECERGLRHVVFSQREHLCSVLRKRPAADYCQC